MEEYTSHDFGPDFEQQVLNAIILEPLFVPKFRSIMDPDAFLLENDRYLVQTILDYFDEYGHTPSRVILAELARKGLFRDKGGVLQRIEDATTVSDIKYIQDRLLSWAKWSAIESVLQGGHDGDLPQEFAKRIGRASQIGDDLLSAHTILGGKECLEEDREIIPTPWSWLNNQLDGGPELGDLAVILTVISGGKTTALVNIARHALSLGKFIVYFTFEDGERKIKRRLEQSICNVTKSELANGRIKYIKKVNRFLIKHEGKCNVKNLQSRRSTVEEAAGFIRSISENSERKVDLVITDYADRFRSDTRYNEPRHMLREIFEDCKWMARDLNIVHWTARQVNKTKVGKEIVGTDSAGEGWGTMESPDLVIGLGRTLEDEQMERVTLFTAKVRDEQDHRTKSLATDFARQRIFDPTEQNNE